MIFISVFQLFTYTKSTKIRIFSSNKMCKECIENCFKIMSIIMTVNVGQKRGFEKKKSTTLLFKIGLQRI